MHLCCQQQQQASRNYDEHSSRIFTSNRCIIYVHSVPTCSERVYVRCVCNCVYGRDGPEKYGNIVHTAVHVRFVPACTRIEYMCTSWYMCTRIGTCVIVAWRVLPRERLDLPRGEKEFVGLERAMKSLPMGKFRSAVA